MAALLVTANTHNLATGPSKQPRGNGDAVACWEADSVAALQPVESFGAYEFRTTKRLSSPHALGGRPVTRVAEDERNGDTSQCYRYPPRHALAVSDRIRLNLPRHLGA